MGVLCIYVCMHVVYVKLKNLFHFKIAEWIIILHSYNANNDNDNYNKNNNAF